MAHSKASDELIFYVNGKKIVEKNADPEVLLLPYLRKKLRLTGTKYGCGGGGCGACTIMVSTIHPISKKILHYPATACLLPICSLHLMAITTTEGIGNSATRLHPVQERLAKAHGSQCGFCSPGMVMSMYTLLRNNPEPSIEDILSSISGNLCRCTGYRPIVDAFRTFAKDCCLYQNVETNMIPEENSLKLFDEKELLPLDPTQELIFPPDLMIRLSNPKVMTTFHGERITWHSPSTLQELLELKMKFPKAPLVVGNTTVGIQMKFEGVLYPVIISPVRIGDLYAVSTSSQGITIGAAVSLAQVKHILNESVSKLPQHKAKIFHALLQQLRTLAGEQIRSMACLGGHVISKGSASDLNPVLAAGGATLNLVSKGKTRTIPLDGSFFSGASDLHPGEVLLSVFIPYSEKRQFVAAFRQAQREENAFAIVNSGMKVEFKDDTDIIKDITIFFGGISSTTVFAKNTRQALIGRHWDDDMLGEACRQILNEVSIPPSAPDGKVEYRRSLMISFVFKFYLQVMQSLEKHVSNALGVSENKSAIRDFKTKAPKTLQIFQEVNSNQPIQDPVGRPIVHQSGIKQATGEAVYVDDMPPVDRELFIAFVTSKKAHAKIVSIDSSDALKIPGVVDIIGAKDVPGINEISGQGPLFSEKEVICVGQIICAVVADTPENARRAVAKVNVTYQDLKPILTVEDAIKNNSFFQPDKQILHGNVEKAFKEADHIIEGEVHIGGQEQFYMETNSVLVVPKGEDDEYNIYISTQDPTTAQLSVAAVLNVPSNRIVATVKRVGGAFGGKITKPGIFASASAVAAQKHKRPIRCVLERNEDMLMTAGRHPFKGIYKVGFMNDGRIVGADVSFYANAGCTPDESILVLIVALLKMDTAYYFPNLNCRAKACKTNLPSNTAFRGFGFPQTGLVMETIMDAVAVNCGLPPNQVRHVNMYKGISKTHYNQEFDAANLMRCWDECMKKSAYVNRRNEVQRFNKENYWKKRGLAIIPLKFTVGFVEKMYHQASALVHIYRDGKVLVSHGGVELGQGLNTKVMQIASRELRVPLTYIHISGTSTEVVPNSIPTGGTIGTDVYGLAVKYACETLWKRLETFIKNNPNGKWEDWVQQAFAERLSLSATGFYKGYDTEMDWEKGEGHVAPYYIYGAACTEIELDCLTGAHKNLRTDIVVDVGESINPGLDIGQIEGGFTQGSGLYTLEELFYSPKGDMYTLGPDKYKIPAVCDVPTEFNVSLLASSKNPYTIYSSKGVGETAVFLGCSVLFAIKDAVDSVRKERNLPKIFTLNSPATPEKVRMACEDQLTKMIPRDKDGTFTPWSVDITK
ncbi:aldehyde oxidase 1-like [Rana temporaria]|uniref:aldehyde oxidase 1-like n=1 Tax=Rana temporaria TaxID=8407 RepID=UPI001AAE04EB|nr:aldehyde oxidase 1-like [Rana temporaria]XP_040213130.1 aldehyde oxidase 1-like [Rana temporaria]